MLDAARPLLPVAALDRDRRARRLRRRRPQAGRVLHSLDQGNPRVAAALSRCQDRLAAINGG